MIVRGALGFVMRVEARGIAPGFDDCVTITPAELGQHVKAQIDGFLAASLRLASR